MSKTEQNSAMLKNNPAAPPEEDIQEGFFLRRPVLSTVLSIIITLVGVLAIKILPIEQFPNMTPPQVEVTATYNGASADVVASSVASLLESQINGVDNMIYMNSVSSSNGKLTLNVTFEVGTDPDQATIDVNNRVQLAMPQLPQEVQRMGVSVLKKSPAMLLVISLVCKDGRYDTTYLSNYALLNIIDELKRLPGVGDVQNFAAQDYAIRVWLDPQKMQQLTLTPSDIASAITSQNAQFAAGRIGDEPMREDIPVTWDIIPPGRLVTTEQFGNIILRTESDGSILRLKDVAKIELGAQTYAFKGKQYESGEAKGIDVLPMGVDLAPGANALSTADSVYATMDRLAKSFPDGIEYSIPYDTTTFVRISIEEVVKTLFEAIVLVFFVVFLFLQNWRATLIPCLAVPVSVVGTFAGMYVLGFSINTLTMFGLVLAIGLVVDDAIVVLENVERHLSEGLLPRKATAKAMKEVTSPVIAIVLVLCAVFIPVAFTGGMAGLMYQQFAITIAVSIVISGCVALTFTPALCALLLKPRHGKPNVFFRWFNAFFEKCTGGYVSVVKVCMRRTLLTLVLFLAVIGGIGGIFPKLPSGLVPDEDQGYLLSLLMLPQGSALSRTADVSDTFSTKVMQLPGVSKMMTFSGFDLISSASKSSTSTMFVMLKPWEERKTEQTSSFSLAKALFGLGMNFPEGMAIAFNPPPVNGMSNTGGFDVWVQDRTGGTLNDLALATQKLLAAASTRPELTGLNSSFNVDAPQIHVDLDREKARTLGVGVSDVFAAMQATFGPQYVNDFNLYGRTFRVYVQSEADARALPKNLNDVYVRNNKGEMVPIIALLNLKYSSGAQIVERFNNFPAAHMTGNPNAGYSSGQAMEAMEAVAKEALPEGYTISWSGSAYQERLASSGSMAVFALALIMVFLILAAQYESWSLPITVLTAVPFGVIGALSGAWLRGLSNDIYFQVALVTLIGLSAKNAILIVEFAVEKMHDGLGLFEAAEEAAKLRFRPIIMTSLAFILGCVPLALSRGAGAASRQALGTSVIAGMLVATLVAPIFIPYFFRQIMRLVHKITGGNASKI